MCGIVGYIGKQEAAPILLEGLKALEYRGYDSAGIAVFSKKREILALKAVGKVASLEEKILSQKKSLSGGLGIAHTRWATHGGVCEKNAHPHSDCEKEIWLAHNGIVENYAELRKALIKKGHVFKSETDTEVIGHLIEEEQKRGGAFEEAVRRALKKIRGTYGLAIFNAKEPEKLIAARNFSPLLVGLGKDEYFIASDPSAVIRHTRDVIYLRDGEIAILSRGGFRIINLDKELVHHAPQTVNWTFEQAQKGGYKHFMLKEIFEQPQAIENALRGRLIAGEGLAKLGGLEVLEKKLGRIERLVILACGSAYYAGLVGKYMIEEYAGLPTEVDVASEFRYRQPIIGPKTGVLVISQSGETADTLAALREAKRKGALTLGIVNVIGSTVAREVDAGIYNYAGPEIGVATTKAFISQLTVLALLALFFGRQRKMSPVTGQRIVKELKNLPALVRVILKQNDEIKKLARKYKKYSNFLYLGRKYNFPIALEGALKLKEISYRHAEAYAAGEMKHGPIALIDKNFPSLFIVPQDSVYEKMISNIQEIKARGGPVIAVATRGDKKIGQMADDVIYIPKTLEMLTPIISAIPLQLFAYHIGTLSGCDVDKPRNLAKSVTVE